MRASRFTDPTKAGLWLFESFEGWAESLTANEMEAVTEYKRSRYLQINDELRDGRVPDRAYSIDRAIDKATLPRAVIVFRALVDTGIINLLDYLIGETIEDEAYSSTSLMRDVAENFARGGTDRRDAVVAEIELPAGAHAAPVDLVAEFNEYELLVPRAAEFVVTEIIYTKPFPTLRARLIE